MAVKSSTMVTMDDIAKEAGVSRATVSYVLNKRKRDNGSPSEDTSKRVIAAATALNYRVNELAKAMVSGKSNVLGVITSPSHAEHFHGITTGIVHAAEERGFLVKMMHVSYIGANQDVVDRCQKWMIAGVVMYGLHHETHAFLSAAFDEVGMPTAVVDENRSLNPNALVFLSDDHSGIRSVVKHLAMIGHANIGFLGGYPDAISLSREHYFREALRSEGLVANNEWIRQSNWLESKIMKDAATAILGDCANRPTAMVCAGDVQAMVMMGVARGLGLSIPVDLSITGYSDSSYAQFLDPPLTTVHQDFVEMGDRATRSLINCVEGADKLEAERILSSVIPTKLIVRESTAPPHSFCLAS